jgi:hypothetical protein
MKRRSLILVIIVGLTILAAHAWQRSVPTASPTVLSFRIGQSFEDVVGASTYPVLERSNDPRESKYLQSGETFVTEPAVILHFNDPEHSFTLPATKFAVLGYMHNRLETVATSPALEKLPFDQAIVILEDLQNQFRAGGWEPWEGDGSTWFDLTPEGKNRLFVRMFEPGFLEQTTLRVPGKYAMTLRLKCTDGCRQEKQPYRFLIDVGVSDDLYEEMKPKKPATPQ